MHIEALAEEASGGSYIISIESSLVSPEALNQLQRKRSLIYCCMLNCMLKLYAEAIYCCFQKLFSEAIGLGPLLQLLGEVSKS